MQLSPSYFVDHSSFICDNSPNTLFLFQLWLCCRCYRKDKTSFIRQTSRRLSLRKPNPLITQENVLAPAEKGQLTPNKDPYPTQKGSSTMALPMSSQQTQQIAESSSSSNGQQTQQQVKEGPKKTSPDTRLPQSHVGSQGL